MHDALSLITDPLVLWFSQNRRDLPWRRDRDPYHVWISEIMLQQTRIEAVIRYYERFMSAVPDIRSLSDIDEDTLLKLWEGLGYYSRARNLHRAARQIMQEYGGVFPQKYEQIRALPGIGDYTAGAIASMCFDQPVPAVDGNVLRVITRVLGCRDNILLPVTKKRITTMLSEIIPARAGMFNEGLMELGEVICLPGGKPDCAHCPIRPFCIACRDNLTDEIPVRIKQQKRTYTDKTVFLIMSDDGRIAIEKRPDHGLLSGLYQLPNTDSHLSEDAIDSLMREWELPNTDISPLPDAKHIFTHITWDMHVFLIRTAATNERFLWVTCESLQRDYSLPTAFRKLLPKSL